jgi:hypothetical protein
MGVISNRLSSDGSAFATKLTIVLAVSEGGRIECLGMFGSSISDSSDEKSNSNVDFGFLIESENVYLIVAQIFLFSFCFFHISSSYQNTAL